MAKTPTALAGCLYIALEHWSDVQPLSERQSPMLSRDPAPFETFLEKGMDLTTRSS